MGAGDGSRPHGQLAHRQERPRQRDDGGAQRDGKRRERSLAHPLGAHCQAAAFDWHHYANFPIGARSDIENVPIERLQAFYRTYYQPDNAVLVVAGAFDPDKALALVAKFFGPISKPARTLPRLYTEEPVQDGQREVVLRRVGNNQWLSVLYHTVPAAHADAVPLEALGELMVVTPAGRLYKSLVESHKASSVDNWTPQMHDPGVQMFFVQVPENDSLAAALSATLATLEGSRAQPFTAGEIERVRIKALKDSEDTLNDPQRFGVALSEWVAPASLQTRRRFCGTNISTATEGRCGTISRKLLCRGRSFNWR